MKIMLLLTLLFRFTFYSVVLAVSLGTFSLAVLADDMAGPPDDKNLQWVKKAWRGEWRMDASVDWNRYSKIHLEKATVEFRKHWERDQRNRSHNRPTPESINRIKSGLSEQLDDVFREELSGNGVYTLSNESAEDIMRITPRIEDLNIVAPDRMRDYIGYSLTDSKGSMTLVLEIRDSVSNTLLASARQHREDPQKGWMEWTTSGANKRAAGFMLRRWARDLNEWLDEARANTLVTTD